MFDLWKRAVRDDDSIREIEWEIRQAGNTAKPIGGPHRRKDTLNQALATPQVQGKTYPFTVQSASYR